MPLCLSMVVVAVLVCDGVVGWVLGDLVRVAWSFFALALFLFFFGRRGRVSLGGSVGFVQWHLFFGGRVNECWIGRSVGRSGLNGTFPLVAELVGF